MRHEGPADSARYVRQKMPGTVGKDQAFSSHCLRLSEVPCTENVDAERDVWTSTSLIPHMTASRLKVRHTRTGAVLHRSDLSMSASADSWMQKSCVQICR